MSIVKCYQAVSDGWGMWRAWGGTKCRRKLIAKPEGSRLLERSGLYEDNIKTDPDKTRTLLNSISGSVWGQVAELYIVIVAMELRLL
jgi:hypothetical protein